MQTGQNLFNGNAIVGFVDYLSGNIIQANGDNNYRATDFIAIEPNTIYCQTYSPAGGQVAFYNKNKQYIEGLLLDGADNVSFTTPSGAVYLRTTTYAPFLNIFSIAKESTNAQTPAGKPYIIVAKDGSGDFSSVTQAVAAAGNGTIVFVKSGIYDNETVKAWGKNISIIGENSLSTVIKNGYNSYDRPPIEMSCGLLKNVTVYAYDGGRPSTQVWGWTAYSVHIDNDALFNNVLNIENCILKSDKNYGVGIGLRKGTVRFANCRFYSRDLAPIFFHDAVAQSVAGDEHIIFENCYGEAEKSNAVLIIHSQKTQGARVLPEFINCSFVSKATDRPQIEAVNQNNTGGTAKQVGTFMGLVNYYQLKSSRNNYPASLNYNA